MSDLPPSDPQRYRLPCGVQSRLQHLLDKQDDGVQLSEEELSEAEGLVDIAELLTLLRLRTERAAG
jgi:hypothetical protein